MPISLKKLQATTDVDVTSDAFISATNKELQFCVARRLRAAGRSCCARNRRAENSLFAQRALTTAWRPLFTLDP